MEERWSQPLGALQSFASRLLLGLSASASQGCPAGLGPLGTVHLALPQLVAFEGSVDNSSISRRCTATGVWHWCHLQRDLVSFLRNVLLGSCWRPQRAKRDGGAAHHQARCERGAGLPSLPWCPAVASVTPRLSAAARPKPASHEGNDRQRRCGEKRTSQRERAVKPSRLSELPNPLQTVP